MQTSDAIALIGAVWIGIKITILVGEWEKAKQIYSEWLKEQPK